MSFLSKCQQCFWFCFVFVEIVKLTLKFLWKKNGHKIAKTTLEKEKKMGEITLPYVKSYYIGCSNQDIVILEMGRQKIDQ